METPVRLNNEVDSIVECMKWDVYFNGKKQTQCLVADAQHGYIKRYRTMFGVPAINRAGHPMTEVLRGTVVIVPTGQTPGL